MNINSVNSFVSLCKYQNMSMASKHLDISQQGLSRQVKSLEDELKITLFNRTSSGVTLTEYGKELEPIFRSLLDNYEKLVQTAHDIVNDTNNIIKVGFSQCVASAIGIDFIVAFNTKFPNVKVEIVELYDKDCYSALISGKIDFAFLVEPFDMSALDCTHIYSDISYVAVNKAHPYATTKSYITMRDLHNEPIFATSDKYILREVFDKMCEEQKIKPNILFSTNFLTSYINLPKDTVGIALIMSFFAKYIDTDNIVIFPLKDGPEFNVQFTRLQNQPLNPKLKTFENFTKDYFVNRLKA